MSHKENVYRLLVERRKSLCDDCLAKELGIRTRQTVNQATRGLAKDGAITRKNGICQDCGNEMIVCSSGRILGDDPNQPPPHARSNPHRTEDDVRDLIIKDLCNRFGEPQTWTGSGSGARFYFKRELGIVVCEAEKGLPYNLPNDHQLTHKSDILVTDDCRRYISIELKHRSAVTDQFKCRSYDMLHLKKQYGDRLIGVLIYVRADTGIKLQQAEKISYPFDHFIGIDADAIEAPDTWNRLACIVHDYLLHRQK